MTARSSDLRRVVLARFVSRSGSEAAFFVGIWGKAAFELDASAYALAAIMFTVSISAIVGSVAAGVLVDRFGPRRVLMYSEWAFVPAALAIMFADTLPVLTGLVALWALVGAPVQTAAASFAPYIAEGDDDLRRVNSWIEGAGSLSFAVGPAAGALIVRFAHVDWVFALDALTSLAAAVLVFGVTLRRPPRVHGAAEHHPVAETLAGIRTVYRHRGLRFYMLAGMATWLAFGSFGALEPLFFRDIVGTTVEAMGWVNSVFGAGFVVGAALLARLPRSVVSARGLALFVGLTGLGTVFYVGWPDLRVIAVAAFFWSVVIGTLEPLLRTLLHRDSPRDVVGRVMGVAEVHHRSGELVPLAFAPALAAAIGVQATLIAGGLFATVAALAGLREAHAIDRQAAMRGVAVPEPEGLKTGDEPLLPLR